MMGTCRALAAAYAATVGSLVAVISTLNAEIDLLTLHREQQQRDREFAVDLWRESGYVLTTPTGGPHSPDATTATTTSYGWASANRRQAAALVKTAEAEGFEPPDPRGSPAFKAGALGRSATLPAISVAGRRRARRCWPG